MCDAEHAAARPFERDLNARLESFELAFRMQTAAPEAFSEDGATTSSDLYSLGVVGYFLLTGRMPFEGDLVHVIRAHLEKAPVPPSEVNADVPSDLEWVILHCLEKNAADRPEDAEALRTELAACADAGAWTLADARAWWDDRA